MPIDPSIALQGRPIQPPDFIGDYAKLMQLDHMRQMAPLEIQARQQQVDAGSLELNQKRQSVADMKAIDDAFSQPGGREAVLNALPGHLKTVALKQFEEIDKSHAAAVEATEKADLARAESFGRAAVAVREHQYSPTAAQIAVSDLKQKYADDPRVGKIIQTVEAQLQANPTPEGIKAIIDPIIMSSSQRKVDISAMDAQARAASAAKPTTATMALEAAGGDPGKALELTRTNPEPSLQSKDVLIGGKPTTVNFNPKTGQYQPVPGVAPVPPASVQYPKPEDEAPSLTPAGIDAAAKLYAKDGTLPPMGMGKQGAAVRTKIINRAAELFPDLDLASNKADFKANQGALTQLQKQRDAIGAFEQTAGKNIDIFLKEAGKVVDTGSPMMNTVARMVSGKMLGSSDQAGYDAARQVAINEIAKITSNPNLAGSLSDSARHEVDAFNPREATLKQSVEVMRLLKQDMANRTIAMDNQLKEIRGRISGKGASSDGQPAAAPPGVFSYQDYLKQKGGK